MKIEMERLMKCHSCGKHATKGVWNGLLPYTSSIWNCISCGPDWRVKHKACLGTGNWWTYDQDGKPRCDKCRVCAGTGWVGPTVPNPSPLESLDI